MNKLEQQRINREERQRIKKEMLLRNLESRWILFAENGYYLYTACTQCSTQAYCRGKSREAVMCETCFMGQKK